MFFEGDGICIEIETRNTSKAGHYGNDLRFWDYVDFNPDKQRHVYLDVPVRVFTEDAMQYQKYMTETMTEIEVDIDL